jgi:hypothetical protein
MRVIAGSLAILIAAPAFGAPAAEPLLTRIEPAHCVAMYDVVELRLKGKGDEVASITTRNGLKDFFVTRPGTVDCTGQREIPWRDDKDRAFIDAVLKAASEAAKVDMAKDYGLGPAPKPTAPRL